MACRWPPLAVTAFVNATSTASVSLSRRSVIASTATNTTSGGTECSTIADNDRAAYDAHVFMTYVAASVSHFARRTHGPVRTWYRAVTCSARRMASSTSDTVGSSTH